jgi:hypothetical protein
MKKVLAFSLAALSLLLLPVAATATQREPVGQRINVLVGFPNTFPAGASFHIGHGWGIGATDLPEQAGIYSFRLDVDGVPRDEDFVLRTADPPAETGFPYPLLNRGWLFNFPAGLTGMHTFTGHWITPCGVAVEFFGYPSPCRTPNEPVDAFSRSLTVTFTP